MPGGGGGEAAEAADRVHGGVVEAVAGLLEEALGVGHLDAVDAGRDGLGARERVRETSRMRRPVIGAGSWRR